MLVSVSEDVSCIKWDPTYRWDEVKTGSSGPLSNTYREHLAGPCQQFAVGMLATQVL